MDYYLRYAAERGFEQWAKQAAQACQERRAWLEAINDQFSLGYTSQEIAAWARGERIEAKGRPTPPVVSLLWRPKKLGGEKCRQFIAACKQYARARKR